MKKVIITLLSFPDGDESRLEVYLATGTFFFDDSRYYSGGNAMRGGNAAAVSSADPVTTLAGGPEKHPLLQRHSRRM
ncbi:hypothetical protein RAA17_24270 [Komagataeibacter rhaeticus]|nr:hypothetical protein [Komagataeibacter rhaeticus]